MFFFVKNYKPIEIRRQLFKVFGNGIMSKNRAKQSCIVFKNGRTNVHHEIRSGRPRLVTEDLLMKINGKIRENPRSTITELLEDFPLMSQNLIHEILLWHVIQNKHRGKLSSKILFVHDNARLYTNQS